MGGVSSRKSDASNGALPARCETAPRRGLFAVARAGFHHSPPGCARRRTARTFSEARRASNYTVSSAWTIVSSEGVVILRTVATYCVGSNFIATPFMQ